MIVPSHLILLLSSIRFFFCCYSESRPKTERRSPHQQVAAGPGKLHQCTRQGGRQVRQLQGLEADQAAEGRPLRELQDRHDRAHCSLCRAEGGVVQHLGLR
jgi:hypothetical protein